MAGLMKIGKLIGLIGGILAIVDGVLRILGDGVGDMIGVPVGLDLGGFVPALTVVISAIIAIVIGLVIVWICLDRFKIKDALVLGIVLIVLGLIGGGFLTILGGILVLLDKFL